MQQIKDYITGIDLIEANSIILVAIAILIFMIAIKMGNIVKAQRVLQTRYTDLVNAFNAAHYEDAKNYAKTASVDSKNQEQPKANLFRKS